MQLFQKKIGRKERFFLIAGPCVIESKENALETSLRLADIADSLDLLLIYKSSFDKANRSSSSSFRGPGMEEGLSILNDVKSVTGLPVLTDIHSPDQAEKVAEVVDFIQIPAFLSRQTDLIESASETGLPINIKKGQFMAPNEMKTAAEKAIKAGCKQTFLCERGSSFGYHNLIVDFRSVDIMHSLGYPVVFDVTHSVQLPGANNGESGGQRQFVPVLSRAAVAAGITGLFIETHMDPDKAMSDGPNSWPLIELKSLLQELIMLDDVVNASDLVR